MHLLSFFQTKRQDRERGEDVILVDARQLVFFVQFVVLNSAEDFMFSGFGFDGYERQFRASFLPNPHFFDKLYKADLLVILNEFSDANFTFLFQF